MKPQASNAIAILDPLLQKLGPQYLAFWTLPNAILTLSGARPYCDGVFWDDAEKGLLEKWSQEISESAAIVTENIKAVWWQASIAEARPGEKFAGYDCFFEPGLRYMLAQTKLLKSTTFDQFQKQTSFAGFLEVIIADLEHQPEFKVYSPENLNDVAFGLLLGYPDKAIVESVEKWQEQDSFAEPLMDADIRGGGYYICPQPVYSYPRHLVSDPSITAHEQLWSTILRDYYTSDFHKSLEQDKAFMKKAKELGNLK